MSPRTDPPPEKYDRHEHETGFTSILKRFLDATPGAIGAALVDAEGEAVDYAGDRIDPFELKVAAAHFRIVLQDIERGGITQRGGPPHRLEVRTARRGFVLEALPDGYALLSILHRDAAFGHADKALDEALRDLHIEARWPCPPGFLRWYEVEVELENDRPRWVKGTRGKVAVQVMGRIVSGLARGEIGYRVSFDDSLAELTLVRGRDDRWYADVEPKGIG